MAGRNKLDVNKSQVMYELLRLISSGVNYAEILGKESKKSPSVVSRQLKILEDNNYVQSQKEKVANKTVFSINYNTILDELFAYLKHNWPSLSKESFYKLDWFHDDPRAQKRKKKDFAELINQMLKEKKEYKTLVMFFEDYDLEIRKFTVNAMHFDMLLDDMLGNLDKNVP